MGCKSTCDSMENAAMPSAERDARRQVRRLKGFYRHLTVFLMVGTVMLVLSLLAAPHGRWLPWPLLAWGVGLLFHAAIPVTGKESALNEILMVVDDFAQHPPD